MSERSQIIRAAYHCLAASEGGNVSVAAILDAAGLGTRAFYRHFESKDTLLLAMFRQDSEKVLSELQATAARAGSPSAALHAWIDGFLGLTADSGRRRRVALLNSLELVRADGYAAERASTMAAHQAAFAQILLEGRQDGSFPWAKPESDAKSILAVLTEAFNAQMLPSPAMNAKAAAAEVVDFALRAIGASSS
jgi:AcrR family transcriptional regulator